MSTRSTKTLTRPEALKFNKRWDGFDHRLLEELFDEAGAASFEEVRHGWWHTVNVSDAAGDVRLWVGKGTIYFYGDHRTMVHADRIREGRDGTPVIRLSTTSGASEPTAAKELEHGETCTDCWTAKSLTGECAC